MLASVALCAAQAADKAAVDFASSQVRLDLQNSLKPYRAPTGPEKDGSSWFMTTVANNAEHMISRVLVASQPPDSSIRLFPRRGRATIMQVASSDAGLLVESTRAFGRHAFLVTIPPATSATLAVRVINTDAQPSLVAWTVPALVSHDKQIAIFLAAVAGLIAASIVITLGVAVMTEHLASRWGAIVLAVLFVSQLSAMGMFEGGWFTAAGGPDGFSVAIAGLALVAGTRLMDVIVPIGDEWPWAPKYLLWGQRVGLAICFLTFVGFPGAMLLTQVLVLVGSAAVTGYLVHRGVTGAQAARVVAPSAAIFSLVALAAAVVALGGFHDNPAAPEIIGGFAAAGAVLLALAISAGEGIAILSGPAARKAPSMVPLVYKPVASKVGKQTPRSPETNSAVEAIGASHQGVFDLDFRDSSVRLSAEAAALIGSANGAKKFEHEAWIARVHTDDRETYRSAIANFQSQAGLAFRIEFRVRSESGRYPWFELRATMMGERTRVVRCLGLLADITTRKESETAATDRALRDPLTHLGNRVALMEALEQFGDRLSGIGFVLLDVDRFKSIHASLGDVGGDAILSETAKRLLGRFGEPNVFRVGGDAFAVLTEGQTDPLETGTAAINLCRKPFHVGARDIFVTASAGAVRGADAFDPLELLKNAELALLQAKRQGGACAKRYTNELAEFAPADAVVLEASLRRALDDGQFELYYQPVVRLIDGSIAGFEALLRWNHPTKGVLLPSEFVSHAEETGLIVSIGRYALERAGHDVADWQRYFPIDPPLFVSVNVSRRQFNDAGFESSIESILNSNAILPGTFNLEVTESAVSTADDAIAILDRLRALHVGLAIDDFGTGLSTLGQLKDIPFDTIKLDKSFLNGASERDDGTVIVNSIVSMARELKRSVVIEGIETEEDALRLRDIGCEFAQGFFFSPPLPSAEALKFIAMHFRHDEDQARPA
ncbi:MAG TPA: GGDEF and EAL domain-containing protein [Rhizomicrobium sp.]|nr:GGDEF and EAL domain-containing protein [Rhizomicrobium sp.]